MTFLFYFAEDCLEEDLAAETEAPNTEVPNTETPNTEPNTESSDYSSPGGTDMGTDESSMPTTIDPSKDEAKALEDMNDMDSELTLLVQTATEFDWAYYTNASDAAAAIAVGLYGHAEFCVHCRSGNEDWRSSIDY